MESIILFNTKIIIKKKNFLATKIKFLMKNNFRSTNIRVFIEILFCVAEKFNFRNAKKKVFLFLFPTTHSRLAIYIKNVCYSGGDFVLINYFIKLILRI